MSQKFSLKKKIISVGVGSTLALSLTPMAFGSTVYSSTDSVGTAYVEPEGSAQMNQYLNDVEFLFTKVFYQTSAGWNVNTVEAAKQGITYNQSIQMVQVLNGLTATNYQSQSKPGASLQYRIGSPEYAKCVLNAVGLGFLAGAASGGGSQLGYLLATQNWREVAWVLARLVGVNALKGGAVGIVTYLVAAGGWCATPWAV